MANQKTPQSSPVRHKQSNNTSPRKTKPRLPFQKINKPAGQYSVEDVKLEFGISTGEWVDLLKEVALYSSKSNNQVHKIGEDIVAKKRETYFGDKNASGTLADLVARQRQQVRDTAVLQYIETIPTWYKNWQMASPDARTAEGQSFVNETIGSRVGRLWTNRLHDVPHSQRRNRTKLACPECEKPMVCLSCDHKTVASSSQVFHPSSC